MTRQAVVPKKRRGPAPTGKGVQVQVRLQPDLLDVLDAVLQTEAEPKMLSRPDVVRLIIREWATSNGMLPLPPPKEDAH